MELLKVVNNHYSNYPMKIVEIQSRGISYSYISGIMHRDICIVDIGLPISISDSTIKYPVRVESKTAEYHKECSVFFSFECKRLKILGFNNILVHNIEQGFELLYF